MRRKRRNRRKRETLIATRVINYETETIQFFFFFLNILDLHICIKLIRCMQNYVRKAYLIIIEKWAENNLQMNPHVTR